MKTVDGIAYYEEGDIVARPFSPAMSGAAKKYPYRQVGLYRVERRKRDGALLWKKYGTYGPPRRGDKVLQADLAECGYPHVEEAGHNVEVRTVEATVAKALKNLGK